MNARTARVAQLAGALLLGALLPGTVLAAAPPHYPATESQVVRDTLHGVVLEDPYRWLEDQDAPATREWIARQTAFSDSVLAAISGREAIRARLAKLLENETRTTPVVIGKRLFYARRDSGQDLTRPCVQEGDGTERVLVDPDTLSPDHTVTASLYAYSNDGRRVALATRRGGQDEVTLAFRDLDPERTLPDVLPKGRYFNTLGFTADGRAVYYSRFEPEGPRVHRHVFGTDPRTDPIVFGEGYDRGTIVNLAMSDNGRWLLLIASRGSTQEHTEVFVLDLQAGTPVKRVVGDLDAISAPEIVGDTMLLKTNWKAPNYRLLAVDLEHPEQEKWREIVPEGASLMQSADPAGGKLFVRWLDHMRVKVTIHDLDGRRIGEMPFTELGTVGMFSGGWDEDALFYSFSSFTTPTRIERWDVARGTRSVWWRSSVVFDPDRYVVEQVEYPSRDGTKVPMFLAHRKDVKPDGTHPAYLTGYGGFNQARQPSWNASAALFLERGGVWADAGLRGGSEFGEPWHKAGMLANKQNVFDDFIAAGEWLVAKRWTTSKRLAIGGNSNGGLLVGAALTQRPDLFRAVYCGFPLLDMLRYQNFLVGRLWVSEYGSSEDSAQFRWLRAYSPYQHVVRGTQYPAVLLTTGDSDTRVAPLHARKMTALLQASTGSDAPILLRYDTRLGHTSASKPVSRQIEDDADRNQFLFWQLGMLNATGDAPEPQLRSKR